MQDKFCIHAFVSGLVQGVCFRSATKAKAQDLNLKGWVRNLSDGRVEVLACGDQEAVLQLQTWLHQGPARAKVDNVEVREAVWEEHDGFEVV
jgi:acylphosphatase